MIAQAKICGLTAPADVEAALQGGASYLGFIFFPRSPRHLTPQVAAALAEPARDRASIVAVTVDADDALTDEIAAVLGPDLFQLHGEESPERAAEIRARTGAGVVKALSVADRVDLDQARRYAPVVDRLMFDAKPPQDAALPGGVGARFDWALLDGLDPGRPWFLAGGLDPSNVAEAVRRTHAPAVDVSSGVERAPGIKDPLLISAFLQALRA